MFSLVMPFVINGKLDTYSVGTGRTFYPIPQKEPLYFGLINVTQFLYIARGSLSELETQLIIANELKYPTQSNEAEKANGKIYALLGGLIKNIKSRNS